MTTQFNDNMVNILQELKGFWSGIISSPDSRKFESQLKVLFLSLIKLGRMSLSRHPPKFDDCQVR